MNDKNTSRKRKNMGGNKKHTIIFLSIIVISLLWPAFLYTADDNVNVKKVLVVMSYHEEYAWQQEVKEGIELPPEALRGTRLAR